MVKPNRGTAPKEILYVAFQPCYPVLDGGTTIQANILSSLSQAGLPLFIAQGGAVDASAYPPGIRQAVRSPKHVRLFARNKALRMIYFNLWLLKTALQRRSAIAFTVGWPLVPVGALLKRLLGMKWAAVLIDTTLPYTAGQLGWSVAQFGLPLGTVKSMEAEAKRADYVTLVNRHEAEYLARAGFSRERVRCIPHRVAVPEKPRPLLSRGYRERLLAGQGIPPHAKLVVFHGNYGYPPNRAAMDRIVSSIAPETARLDPAIYFLLAGSGKAPGALPPNVRFLGFVPDLSELLSNADLEILPMESGSGLKNKALDALAAGLPIIATGAALYGLAEEGNPALRAELGEFPEKIRDLLRQPEFLAGMGERGWRYARDNYGRDNSAEYLRMVESLAGDPR